MSDTHRLPDETRAKIVDLVKRYQSDEEFAQRLKHSPIPTLEDAGLSAQTAETVMSMAHLDSAGEVEGYQRCQDGTCWFWVSICPGTCRVTCQTLVTI